MAVISIVEANSVASSSHQNGLIGQVNANTTTLSGEVTDRQNADAAETTARQAADAALQTRLGTGVDSAATGSTDASTGTATAQLASLRTRLGTGIGTDSNALTGTATAQLNGLKTRVSTLESSGSATVPFAKFSTSSGSVAATAWSNVTMDTASSFNTAGLVTRSGAAYTLTRSGLWTIEFVYSQNSTSTSSRVAICSINLNNDPGASSVVKALTANGSVGLRLAGQITIEDYFASGTVIGAALYNSVADTLIAPTSISFKYAGTIGV